MLKALRENSRSFLIWILFGIIIAFFIISFGPQSSADQFNCAGRTAYIAKIGDRELSNTSWNYAMNVLGFGNATGARARQGRMRETAMDKLIERELFAQAAEASGFRITDDFIDKKIAAGDIILMGQTLPPGTKIYVDEDDIFDYDALERWVVQGLGLSSVREFRQQQRRELLAEFMRQQLIYAARVSPEEVRTRYELEQTTVAIDYVKFEPARYRIGMALTPTEVAAYLAGNEQDIKQKYETDKRLYTAVKPELRARTIFVKRENPVAPPAEAAPAQGDDDTDEPAEPAPPADPTLDPAHARAQAARARITEGEEFAVVARELSEEPRSRVRGGDLGWRKLDSLGATELTAAAKTLEVGALSEVITTANGFYLLLIEDKREGDLTYEQVSLEIAEKLALEAYAREAAHRDADAALAAAQAGTPLAEQFPDNPEEPEDATKTGALYFEGPNVPAQSPPIDEEAPVEATTGDGQGTAAAPDATAAAATDDERIQGEIPRPAELAHSKVVSVSGIPRNGNIVAGPGMNPYIGNSAELANDLFKKLEAGQLAPKVYEVDNGFVVVVVTGKQQPDMENFERTRAQMNLAYAREKNFRTLETWKLARCKTLADAGEITINPQAVSYPDPDTGKSVSSGYQPCQAGAPLGGLQFQQ